MSNCPSVKFMQCLQFAAHKHRHQRRITSNQTPYINHPINVATILKLEGQVDDEALLMGALLHDVIEYTDTTFLEIEALFGEEVVAIVRSVSDDRASDLSERIRNQLEAIPRLNKKAKLIKLAEKLENLRDLQQNPPVDWNTESTTDYYEYALQVVNALRGTNKQLEDECDEIFREKKIIASSQ